MPSKFLEGIFLSTIAITIAQSVDSYVNALGVER